MTEIFDLDSVEFWYCMARFADRVSARLRWGDLPGRQALQDYYRAIRRRKSALARKPRQPRMPLPVNPDLDPAVDGYEIRAYWSARRWCERPGVGDYAWQSGPPVWWNGPSWLDE